MRFRRSTDSIRQRARAARWGGGGRGVGRCNNARARDRSPAWLSPGSRTPADPPPPHPESHKLIIRKTWRIIKALLFTSRAFTVACLNAFCENAPTSGVEVAVKMLRSSQVRQHKHTSTNVNRSFVLLKSCFLPSISNFLFFFFTLLLAIRITQIL
jgi:hypothetical protein